MTRGEIYYRELMLLGWSITSQGAIKATFQFATEDDIEFLKAVTMAKGKHAGQIIDCAFSLSDQDDQVTPEKREFADLPPSAQAGILCNDGAFIAWTECKDAARFVRNHCGVQSRRELDADGPARVKWERMLSEYLCAKYSDYPEAQ